MSVTEDHLLDGRISYRQKIHGHRTGIEPVLLAAVVPASPGQSVLEAGTGAGAALLCLAHRVNGIHGIGLEIDPDLAGLAADNFRHNHFSQLNAVTADVLAAPFTKGKHLFDHVLANPPWHDADSTLSPDPGRARAHHASGPVLRDWVLALAALLRPRGTITLVLPTASLTSVLSSLILARCGACHILPLWPRQHKPAKLFIVQSRKFARGGDMILPGLTLHAEAGGYTQEAEHALRNGASIMI